MHGIISSLGAGNEVNWVLTHKDSAAVYEGWSVPGNMEDGKALING